MRRAPLSPCRHVKQIQLRVLLVAIAGCDPRKNPHAFALIQGSKLARFNQHLWNFFS
jgi:hypothetical protein